MEAQHATCCNTLATGTANCQTAKLPAVLETEKSTYISGKGFFQKLSSFFSIGVFVSKNRKNGSSGRIFFLELGHIWYTYANKIFLRIWSRPE
jgi:hypothetical protein